MAKPNTTEIGKRAEEAACAFLETQGLQLIESNYRTRHGEIDLIMRDQDDIVFIEVRSRARIDYGTALESITTNKIKKIVKAATHFLQVRRCLYKVTSRFDFIIIQPNAGKMQLEWIKNAFWVEN
jgi:putative endonuclease